MCHEYSHAQKIMYQRLGNIEMKKKWTRKLAGIEN